MIIINNISNILDDKQWKINSWHCVKKFPNTEFYLVRILPYLERIRTNTDQEKLRIRTFFAQCERSRNRYDSCYWKVRADNENTNSSQQSLDLDISSRLLNDTFVSSRHTNFYYWIVKHVEEHKNKKGYQKWNRSFPHWRVFYLGFLSQTFMNHRTAGERGSPFLSPLYHLYPIHRHLDINRKELCWACVKYLLQEKNRRNMK